MTVKTKKIVTETENDPLTSQIIACSYKVHNELGPGFNERIYHNALMVALGQEDLRLETEESHDVFYQGKKVGRFRLDLVVENEVVVEVKAIAGSIPKVFGGQVLSYLKSSRYKTGLLINFGNKSCQVRRLILKEGTLNHRNHLLKSP